MRSKKEIPMESKYENIKKKKSTGMNFSCGLGYCGFSRVRINKKEKATKK
jgi:hypothetical protein